MAMWDSKNNKETTVSATGSEVKSTNPFSIQLSFSPLRLSSNRMNSINLVVRVKNISNEAQLVSVDAMLPRNCMLGFDQACINKTTEKRSGELAPGAFKDVQIEIWANNQTKSGNYPVEVTAFAHYVGYEKVIGYIKKGTSLRVV
ncbi:hypothetical protein HY988_07420 [Candidatus Micrarchaeota archaeon]|nr:hypothetical protein [Candidatus Micrarchaeota archaeon]